MTRTEILQTAKPILFSTPMVQAIIDGKKIQTRRIIKPNRQGEEMWTYSHTHTPEVRDSFGSHYPRYIINTPGYDYRGCYLYVRETWGNWNYDDPECNALYFQYRADYPNGAKTYMYDDEYECDLPKWHPSIHMPKEAARIFLRVTGVRAERLQDISESDAKAEGIKSYFMHKEHGGEWHESNGSFVGVNNTYPTRKEAFSELWNSTIKPADFDCYGWDANPWVWVYEFERVVTDG